MPKFMTLHFPSKELRPARAIFALTVAMIFVPNSNAQSAGTAPAQGVPDSSDAAAKAAARKAKFEEARRRLEQSAESSAKEVASDPNQTLFVSPARVNMLMGETHAFCVFDIEGRDLTSAAKWTLSSSGVVSLMPGLEPEVVSKSLGTVTLRADVGGKSAEAEINVLTADKMTPGAVKWSAAQIPGFRTTKVVPAVPSARGPDTYVTEQNQRGEILLRAFLEDGRQLWMKRGPASTDPNEAGAKAKSGPTGTQPRP